jgi:shikimate kinase
VDGYYDHHALTQLDRHVALYGLITRETRAIAQRAAALCGLNYIDIRRLAEHHAQRSAEQIVLAQGEAVLLSCEVDALERALTDRPYGLMALSDGVLTRCGAIDQLKGSAALVALDLDLPNLFWRLRSATKAAGAGQPTTTAAYDPLAGPFERIEDLRPYVQMRYPAIEAAGHRLVMRGRSVEQLSRELADYVKSVGRKPK